VRRASFDVRGEPREHRLVRGGFGEAAIGQGLRGHEGLVQLAGAPAMTLVDVAADHDRVHDREDARAGEVVALGRHMIREQPADVVRARVERRRRAGGVQRIELAVGEHPGEGLVGTDARDADRGREIEGELLVAAGRLLAAGEVLGVGDLDAVLVGHDAADPDRRGHLVLGAADAFTGEVAGLRDAAAPRDEDARVAEEARRERGDRDERPVVAA
jgi:hypothetical protein